MDKQREHLQLELISESASTTRSLNVRPGFLSRLDRLFRRIVPGYNYLRGKRGGSRTSLEARDAASARIRARIAKANARRDQHTDVLLETGISKSEFCSKLDYLLRKKLLEQQQEPEEVLLEAIQLQTVNLEEVTGEEVTGEEQAKGIQDDVQMEDLQTGEEQTGNVQPGNVQPGNVQPGSPQPGQNQNKETQLNQDHIMQDIEMNRGQDRAIAR